MMDTENIPLTIRYTYNKLVRDKIPENIDSKPGSKSKYRILNDNEYLIELNKKVLEEANEFIEDNSIEELGDLMEVINAIMKLKGYKLAEMIPSAGIDGGGHECAGSIKYIEGLGEEVLSEFVNEIRNMSEL